MSAFFSFRRPEQITIQLNGQFVLNANEFNGWGIIGPYDNTNQQDLGNVSAAPSVFAGGLSFPYAVNLIEFRAQHRNNNNNAQAWGWRIHRQLKTPGTTSALNINMWSQVDDNGGVGPNGYGNTNPQNTTHDFTTLAEAQNIPPGWLIGLGVEAPTADTTDRWVQIMTGYMLFERAD